MAEPLTDSEIRERAYREVAAKFRWLAHLTVFLVGSATIVIAWVMAGRGYPWFAWVVGVWAAALVAHFVLVFFPRRRGESRSPRGSGPPDGST
jgi:hypothetical protein